MIAISSLQQLISVVTLDTDEMLTPCQKELDQAKKKGELYQTKPKC